MRTLRLVPALLLAGCGLFEVEPIPPIEPPYGGLSVDERRDVAELVLEALTASPFPEAELLVYNCPDLNDGCTGAAYRIDDVCHPFAEPQVPGACAATGARLAAGRPHTFATCAGADCSGCSQDVPADMPPQLFSEQVYFLGGSIYCRQPCEAATDCADAE